MKKIIVVTPATHFKNQGAAQKDILATVKMMQQVGHQVVLYTIHTPAQDRETVSSTYEPLGVKVKFFEVSGLIRNWIKYIVQEPALFDRAATGFADLVNDDEFKDFVKSFSPDLIFSFCSYSWPVLEFSYLHGVKSVFRSHNFEASFFWEALNFFEKINPVNWLRFLAKWRGEYLAAKWSDKIATLPFAEIAKYKKWQPDKTNIWTLAFLPESIRPVRVQTSKIPINLFFLGASYNVVFHRRGAELLITKIAPMVLARAPGQFRFHICGGKLPEYLVKQCNQDTIVYEGYVPDLEAFLGTMEAGVFPVMTGKTMKGKVFETLCRAFPMVIPVVGKGGYDLKHDQEVLIADSVAEFVVQILRLTDPDLRSRLSQGAHNFAEREFTEIVLKNKLQNLI